MKSKFNETTYKTARRKAVERLYALERISKEQFDDNCSSFMARHLAGLLGLPCRQKLESKQSIWQWSQGLLSEADPREPPKTRPSKPKVTKAERKEARRKYWHETFGVELTADQREQRERQRAAKAVTEKKIEVNSDAFLSSYEWRRVRMMVLKRDGRKCVCCGATPENGAVMNVDHIKPRRFFPEMALDPSNLQVLCGDCNHGKGNWDMTDWRQAATT